MTHKPEVAGDTDLLPAAPPLANVRCMIESAHQSETQAVNTSLTLMYWRVVPGRQRADCADELVSTLSRQLTLENGRGFSIRNLRHMMRFAEAPA